MVQLTNIATGIMQTILDQGYCDRFTLAPSTAIWMGVLGGSGLVAQEGDRYVLHPSQQGKSRNAVLFLTAVVEASAFYDVGLGHEDTGGAFILHKFDYHYSGWVGAAYEEGRS